MTITRTHFEGVNPVRVTLPESTLPDAVEATLAHIRTQHPHALVLRMNGTEATLWGGRDPEYIEFGLCYFLKTQAD